MNNCKFCNNTRREPGIPGPCAWCEVRPTVIGMDPGKPGSDMTCKAVFKRDASGLQLQLCAASRDPQQLHWRAPISADLPRIQGQPRAGISKIDKGSTLVGLNVVIEPGPNDDVRVAISVHVTSGRDRASEIGIRLVALDGPASCRGKAGRRAEVDEGSPLVHFAVVVQMGPDDHVRVAIPVHVPRG